ncbi:MAG TPA: thiamine diphosphokinase [Gaiella sp.]
MQNEETVVVVAAGEGPDVSPAVPAGSRVVAADGGLERALALGLEVALVVGDLDSVAATALDAAERNGTRVVRHPAAKDATDLELAVDEALADGPARLLVVASAEGRLDHLLSALLVLAAPRLAATEVDALVGGALVHVVRTERTLAGEPGELVSLLPVHGPAEGVVTDGLDYPLRRETLEPGSSRGVSNVFSGREARVSLECGVLLAVRPARSEEEPG